MIKLIRVFEKALVNIRKVVSKSEAQNLLFIRKSIVAKKIFKGEKFSKENLTMQKTRKWNFSNVME